LLRESDDSEETRGEKGNWEALVGLGTENSPKIWKGRSWEERKSETPKFFQLSSLPKRKNTKTARGWDLPLK